VFLDGYTDPNNFTSTFQWPGLSITDHYAEFRDRADAYRALAVRFVLVRAGESLDPVLLRWAPSLPADNVLLRPGESIETVLPAGTAAQGLVGSIFVMIGILGDASTGALLVEARTADGCRGGTGSISLAAGNRPLTLRLDAPFLCSRTRSCGFGSPTPAARPRWWFGATPGRPGRCAQA